MFKVLIDIFLSFQYICIIRYVQSFNPKFLRKTSHYIPMPIKHVKLISIVRTLQLYQYLLSEESVFLINNQISFDYREVHVQ